MKKIIVSGILLALCTFSLTAGPARPGRIVYTQPDGTTIGIYLHGDEFGHWATDDSGRIIAQDEDGYWHVSAQSAASAVDRLRENASVRRVDANKTRREYTARLASSNTGSPRIPVILIGFNGSGEGFSKSAEDFKAMLNEEGYSANNAIGSVFDFFNENSHGRFTPQFEVLGPVTLDNNKSYYGGNDWSGNDKLPEMALVHAAQKLDATVDFSRYDNDGDGTVDFVMFYFSGHDEAQGGGSNCIWSHAWYLSASSNARNNRTFDNVKLDRYFCTAELKDANGSTMCSIGTTCHEFAHTLGLPDYYDTDYGTNSSPNDMYTYSTMCSGSYNNDSTTPPYFTAEELVTLGWYQAPELISSVGPRTLGPVNFPDAAEYHGYKVETGNPGEYFMMEVRTGLRWDAGLPAGMLVYHVDKSQNVISGGTTAASTWDNNELNAWGSHPCCYIIPAVDQDNLQYGLIYYQPQDMWYFDEETYLGGIIFPNEGVTSYTPKAWDGNELPLSFSNITYSSASKTVSMNVVNTYGLDYNYILDPGNGSYHVGDVFALTLVETEGSRKPQTAIAWYLDDEPVSGTSVTLTAGKHVIEARFTTQEGKNKVIELELTVE